MYSTFKPSFKDSATYLFVLSSSAFLVDKAPSEPVAFTADDLTISSCYTLSRRTIAQSLDQSLDMLQLLLNQSDKPDTVSFDA